MGPLDIEKALQGHPVLLRNGEKAYIRYREVELPIKRQLVGYRKPNSADYMLVSWAADGQNFTSRSIDIVGMWKSAPLVFLYWGEIKRAYNYIAKDKDGEWWAYVEKPIRRDDDYYMGAPCTSLKAFSNKIFPDCDWSESLMERPR